MDLTRLIVRVSATGVRFHTLQIRYSMFSWRYVESKIMPWCKVTTVCFPKIDKKSLESWLMCMIYVLCNT